MTLNLDCNSNGHTGVGTAATPRARTDHVVAQVVAHVQLLQLAELAQLLENLLVEVFELLLDLLWRDAGRGQALLARRNDLGLRVLVEVREAHGLREHGPVVRARAAVAVPTRAHLEVEGAVHPARAAGRRETEAKRKQI